MRMSKCKAVLDSQKVSSLSVPKKVTQTKQSSEDSSSEEKKKK